jgi:hypothetical protein
VRPDGLSRDPPSSVVCLKLSLLRMDVACDRIEASQAGAYVAIRRSKTEERVELGPAPACRESKLLRSHSLYSSTPRTFGPGALFTIVHRLPWGMLIMFVGIQVNNITGVINLPIK